MICLVNWLFLCYVVYRASIRFVTGLEMEVSRMKKIISLVLVFCMLFSLGVSAFAEEAGGDTGGGSVPAAPASGGDTGGGDTGGGDTGGGSVPDAPASGGESGGGSVPDAPASGGDTGGGSAPAAAPVMLASSAPALASPPGATGGGTVTETVGNVYAGNEGKSVTVGGVTVSFDASGQGENISQVTKDESGAIHIDANVDGSDEAVKVEGNTTVNITGQVDSDDYGIEAKGGSNVTADSVSAISGYGVEAGGGSTINVVNNVSAEAGVGVNAGGNATVNVGGDVTSQNSRGVHAANNKVVSVTRNVSGSDYGVYAISGNVTVGGTVTATDGTGVFAQEESTVSTGDVTSENGTGIHAESGSTVTVLGTVTGGTIGIDANGSTVEVDGDVIGEYGSGVVANDSTVEVSGDVTGAEIGISVQIEGDTAAKQSTVIVEGNVKATEEKGYTIELNVPDDASLETVKDVLPEIVVQSIDSKADYVVCTGDTSEQKREDIATAVLESIKYIVETEAKNTDGSDSTVTVDLVRYNTEEAVETKDLLNADGTTKKTLTVATTSTQLVVAVDKTKGSVVGVTVGNEKSASNPDGNVITHDEENDQWIITVGIGGGLKVIATIDKPAPEPEPGPEPQPEPEPKPQPLPVDPDPVKPDPVKPDPSQRSETVQVRQETVSTAWVKLDYGHKNPLENILIIDMTTTNIAVFLTHTLRTFNRRNAIGTVMIKVANGSFTISANDLLQLLGSEAACAFLVRGDMLEIRVGDEHVASLVMTSAA